MVSLASDRKFSGSIQRRRHALAVRRAWFSARAGVQGPLFIWIETTVML